MSDVGVKTIFEKDTCKMVWATMVLEIKGVWIGTLYKLFKSTMANGCSSFGNSSTKTCFSYTKCSSSITMSNKKKIHSYFP